MLTKATDQIPILKVTGGDIAHTDDTLAVEEPLEIVLIYSSAGARLQKSISVTMRTPRNDKELALGFLFTEGIIRSLADIDDTSSFAEIDNTITIPLKDGIQVDLQKLERHFYTSSSCGVCGKSSISAVRLATNNDFSQTDMPVITATLLHELPQRLRARQDVFESTGGLHASALFDDTGDLLLLREDVGRHNALDKLLGNALINNMLPLDKYILLLSGRASFELIQKATVGGIKIIAAVGAPSSLAVEMAREFDITLVGFLRNNRFNIYCGEKRIKVNDK